MQLCGVHSRHSLLLLPQGAEEMMAAPMTVGDRVLVEGMAGEIAFLGDDLPGA